jgi:hypothetical protein
VPLASGGRIAIASSAALRRRPDYAASTSASRIPHRPWRALERRGHTPAGTADPIHEHRLDTLARRPLRCRLCGSVVTREEESIAVDGRRVHRRTNPAGFEFEFGCFRAAPGARSEGSPTLEHTWFPGCTWVFALCRTCHAQLGWRFEGGESYFFALILARLIANGGDRGHSTSS